MKFWLLIFLLLPGMASAARMPDRIEHVFTFEGEDARRLALAFGISDQKPASLTLPWQANTALCYKGPGKDGGTETQLCDPSDPPINSLEYIPAPTPKLILKGRWYDGETGSSADMPRYAFSSPVFGGQQQLSDWAALQHKFFSDTSKLKQQKIKLFEGETGLVQIEVATFGERTFMTFSIDDRSSSERAKALRHYEECLKWHRQNPVIDGGC